MPKQVQFIWKFGTCTLNSCLVSQLNLFLGHLRSHERCNQECFSPQTQRFACILNSLFWKIQFNWENSAKSRWSTSRSWQAEKRNAQHSAGKVNLIKMSRGLKKGNKNVEKTIEVWYQWKCCSSTPVKSFTSVYNELKYWSLCVGKIFEPE